jgi:DNA polymerase III subunit alpha, Gram-positive type
LTTNDDDDVINIPPTTQPAVATYKTPSAKKIYSKINLSKTIYIAFDLETTGFSSVRNHIIEIGLIMLDDVGGKIQESGFDTLIRPPCPIPWNITELTGIDDSHVQGIDTFHEVGKSLVIHIMEQIRLYEDKHKTTIKNYVFVAHNGRRFDIRFLFYKLNELKLSLFGDLVSKSYILDTCSLARKAPKKTFKKTTNCLHYTNIALAWNYQATIEP